MKYLKINEYEKNIKLLRDNKNKSIIKLIYDEVKSKIKNGVYNPEDCTSYPLNIPSHPSLSRDEIVKSISDYGIIVDHLISMEYNGEKVYYIDPDVSNLLMDTKLSINSDFLELPFKEIYVQYISDIKSPKDVSMRGFFAHISESDGIRNLSIVISSSAEFSAIDVPIKNCDDLQKSFNDLLKSYILDDKRVGDCESLTMDDNIFFIEIILNTIIYIGCQNAEMKEIFPIPEKELTKGKTRSESDKIRSHIKNSTQFPYIYVKHRWGKDEDREAHRFGKRLNKEVLVAAYWAGRWIGPHDSPERKKVLTRISSYLKGAGGELSNKIHIVK